MMNSPIKKQILKVINEKINRLEVEYKETCEELDRECEIKKEEALDKAVDSVLSKFN